MTCETQVGVKLTNLQTKATSIWSYEVFLEKIYEMRELYQNFLESGSVEYNEGNPFDIKTQQSIGVANLYLKNLAYLFEIQRELPILDHMGEQWTGELQVEMYLFIEITFSIPKLLDENGNIQETVNREGLEPKSLIGKTIHITFRIIKAFHLPEETYTNIYCKYLFWGQEHQTFVSYLSVNFRIAKRI